MRPIEHRTFRIPVDWKRMLDNALDFEAPCAHLHQVLDRHMA